MRAVDIIIKKRNGEPLTPAEIKFFIEGYTTGEITDYQASAFAMAVFFRGMSAPETVALTEALVQSGQQLDLSDIAPLVADKHSTGGVGDKTTMVVTPLVAATGLPIGKMSGRGLGYFGGTVDKLETIPGFRAALSEAEFRAGLANVGLVVAGQSHDLAPADGKLYSLRDVTGTVESLPLIASSVMSKKIAAGANCIVLDVKHGKGAFMKTLADATALAEAMVAIGKGVGRQVRAVLSSMEQPLGHAVGNALEVREAIETLQGRGPADLEELAYLLGSQLLLMAGKAETEAAAREQLKHALESGAAFEKYKAFIANQGGDVSYIDYPEKLPQAPHVRQVRAGQAGFVGAIDAEQVGIVGYTLGTGRKVKTDNIDPAVGLIILKKVGESLQPDDVICELHAAHAAQLDEAEQAVLAAFTVSPNPVPAPPLVDKIVS